MPVITYNAKMNVLVAAKGHPYLRDAFMAIFDKMEGVAATLVEQPAAALLMNPQAMADFDALVLYDMPGLDFAAADAPDQRMPDDQFKAGFLALLDQGKGIVALHHAIAGWPAWETYAELLGGAFRYRAGSLRGQPVLDGGYHHDVTYDAVVLAKDHPVLTGIPERFSLTDELYLFEAFEDKITPLLAADHRFADQHFYSAQRAVAGQMFDNKDWHRPDGTRLIGWAKAAGNSPLVYLQPGDGPTAYENPHYQRLVRNAIDWVISPEAQAWARRQASS